MRWVWTWLISNGVIYDGLKLFGRGRCSWASSSGAIAAFVIDRRLVAAAVTALIGAALSFVGLINAYEVAWNASQQITLGYLLFAAVLGYFAWLGRDEDNTELDDSLLFVNGTLMRGLLHGNLEGAEFLEEVSTAPAYRVHTIGDVHPGMYRVAEGTKEPRTRAVTPCPPRSCSRWLKGSRLGCTGARWNSRTAGPCQASSSTARRPSHTQKSPSTVGGATTDRHPTSDDPRPLVETIPVPHTRPVGVPTPGRPGTAAPRVQIGHPR